MDFARRMFDMVHESKKVILKYEAKELTPNEFLVLSEIGSYCEKEIPLTVSELSRCFNAPLPAVSRHLRNLEGKGYINRVTDLNDRRYTYITITDKGRKCFDKHYGMYVDIYSEALEGFSDEELAFFFNMFDKINTKLRPQLGALSGNLDVIND